MPLRSTPRGPRLGLPVSGQLKQRCHRPRTGTASCLRLALAGSLGSAHEAQLQAPQPDTDTDTGTQSPCAKSHGSLPAASACRSNSLLRVVATSAVPARTMSSQVGRVRAPPPGAVLCEIWHGGSPASTVHTVALGRGLTPPVSPSHLTRGHKAAADARNVKPGHNGPQRREVQLDASLVDWAVHRPGTPCDYAHQHPSAWCRPRGG